MKYPEIIEKLKEIFPNGVEDFAYEEIPFPSEYSEEALAAQADKDKFYKTIESKTNTTEWASLYKQYLDMPSKYYVAKKEWKEANQLSWEEVDQYGGEGQGDDWWSVKYFPEHDVYIKVSGFYASYDGTSFNGWDDCSEVRPIQKTITVYE